MADPTPKPNIVLRTTDSRRGNLTVPSTKITVDELKNVEQALMHPPTRVNWPTAATSVVGAIYVAAKAFADAPDGKLKNAGLFVFVVSILVIGGVVATTWKQLLQKHPHHDKALGDVRDLIKTQDSDA